MKNLDHKGEVSFERILHLCIRYANLQEQSGSSCLIGWKLEVGVAS